MTLDEMLAVEIRLLASHYSPLTLDLLQKEYPVLFNESVDVDTLRTAADELASRDVLTETNECLSLTANGRRWSHEKLLKFHFEAGAAMSVSSASDAEYSHRLFEAYGILGITDESQREFLATSIESLPEPVLDVGCGRGTITGILQRRTDRQFLGIDISADSIGAARADNPNVRYMVHDFNELSSFRPHYQSALLVDSLYFAKDPSRLLCAISERVPVGGGIIALYSAYAGPGTDSVKLSPSNTPLWQFAENGRIEIDVTDFTSSEVDIWQTKRNVIAELRDGYYDERSAYLYYSRLNEIAVLANMTASGRSARFGFAIRVTDAIV